MKSLSCFLANFANLISFIFHFFETLPLKKVLPLHVGNVVSLVSRTGRHLQRYDRGCRQVVGCIPYRYRKAKKLNGTCSEELEVLVISSQKGQAMLFPKGGWEKDESMEDAALRETIEEAGVLGNVECKLGKWRYKSKRGGMMHEGYMFSLLVEQQLDIWPEKNFRKRRWVTVDEAREVCQQWWMREALEELVRQHALLQQQKEEMRKTANL